MIAFVIRLCLFAGLAIGSVCVAQEFPARPVRIIVGTPPGGSVDIAARVVGEKLAETWKQAVVVENRVGASEMIASELVSKAAPDGYTLLMASLNIVTINPAVFAKLPYDAASAFSPVVLATRNPMVFIAASSAPFSTVKELIEFARSQSSGVSWSSAGNATLNHIAGEWLAAETGVRLFHVPYKGAPAATNAVMTGDVPFGVVTPALAIPLVKSGRLKVLAVTTAERSVLAPEWPTVAESTGIRQFDAAVEVALFAPAGTSPALVAKINTDAVRSLQLPEVRERLVGMGVEPVRSTPEELASIIRMRRSQIQQIVNRSGIKVQ